MKCPLSGDPWQTKFTWDDKGAADRGFAEAFCRGLKMCASRRAASEHYLVSAEGQNGPLKSCYFEIRLQNYTVLTSHNLVRTTIYSWLIVSTFSPTLLVGLFLDGIRLLGISLTMVVRCLNPHFSNISAVK